MAAADPAQQVDAPSDFGSDPRAVVARWVSELQLAQKGMDPWHRKGDQVIRKYLDESEEAIDVRRREFCLLWANVETLKPAIYARTPTAVVGRRWKDADDVARVASEVLERAINFSLDAFDFADRMLGVRDEFLLVGRGQAWARYVPHIVTKQKPTPAAANDQDRAPVEPPDGEVTNDQNTYDQVIWEEAVVDHVNWKDFGHNPARTWAEVRFVWRRAFMTRDELIDRFGKEKGEECPLNWRLDQTTTSEGKEDTQFNKAEVYELWDKRSRKVFWICKAYTEQPLDVRDDPLGLKDFFPCPRALLATHGPESLIPTPDYEFYRSQAETITDLTRRISLLTDALKVRGFYAGTEKDQLQDLLAAETNTLVPIESWAAFADKGGMDGVIAWLPIEQVASALKVAIETRQQMLQDVYEITGIADIMRGDTDPDETATAQKIKSTWGSSRVRDKQKELARFARSLCQTMGEIIAKKFSADTLMRMTGVKLFRDPNEKMTFQHQLAMTAQMAQASGAQPPQPSAEQLRMLADPTWAEVEQLLHDDELRSFRIDIETDSTIEPNDAEEKESRVEFIEAVAQYLEKTMAVVQLAPQMLPVVVEGLKFLVRGFRVGREMEDVIDQALDKLQAAAGQQQPGQQQSGPNPQVEAMKGQAAMTGAQAKMMDARTNQFRAQTDRQEAVAGAQLDAARIHMEGQDAAFDRQHAAALQGSQQQHEQVQQGQNIAADLQQGAIHAIERQYGREVIDPHLIPPEQQRR